MKSTDVIQHGEAPFLASHQAVDTPCMNQMKRFAMPLIGRVIEGVVSGRKRFSVVVTPVE